MSTARMAVGFEELCFVGLVCESVSVTRAIDLGTNATTQVNTDLLVEALHQQTQCLEQQTVTDELLVRVKLGVLSYQGHLQIRNSYSDDLCEL